MRWYAFLLYPFALLYDLVTSLRNFFFEIGWLKMKNSRLPSIVVGNLSVGGTGKTPMVELLIGILLKQHRVATLSRGYGRASRGFLKASESSQPIDIGDEPYQIYRKFNGKVPVFVGEDRVSAADLIFEDSPNTDVLLLDDAFQHRYFQADLSILLTTYSSPFVDDFLLPMGRLREARSGAKRADVVIVTKSPSDLEAKTKADLIEQIRKAAGLDKPVLFSSIRYGKPYRLSPEVEFSTAVILFSGLANDEPLQDFVRSNFDLLAVHSYADHHSYSSQDFQELSATFEKFAAQKPILLTTEKDAGKVKSAAPKGFLSEIPIFVLPIEVAIVEEDLVILEKLIQLKVLEKGRNR